MPRRPSRSLALAATLLLALASISACASAGGAARERALMPALAQAWVGVRADVARGASAQGVAADQINPVLAQWTAALEAGDEQVVLMLAAWNWDTLKALATLGVQERLDHQEIGPSVAGSLLERIAKFDQGLRALAPPAPAPAGRA